MRIPAALFPMILALAACSGAAPQRGDAPPHETPMRVATYNTSLFSDEAGGLIRQLEGDDAHARKIAAVLQKVRPDLVLLNEFDYDPAHRAADLFQQRYLDVAQPGGGEPLRYPYRYLAPVNTGVPSGLDLDRNGSVGAQGRERGNDAWGYGLHPGQYGMLVLSRFPIDEAGVRTFQLLRWSALPGATNPVDPTTRQPFYTDHVWAQLRLSSKSHWDVPVRTPGGTVHFLVSHPTPPVFDGPENRNGLRNADEIRLWHEYLTPGDAPRDVYSDVAAIVARRVAKDAAAGHPDAARLLGEVDRKLVKQTVMTSVYGVTFIGARGQVSDRLRERGWKLYDPGSFSAANYAAKVTLDGIKELFCSARGIMTWLSQVAVAVARTGQPVFWHTPLGLPVYQPYRKKVSGVGEGGWGGRRAAAGGPRQVCRPGG